MSSLVELLLVICAWGVLCMVISEVAQRRGRLFVIKLFFAVWVLDLALTLIFGELVGETTF